MCAKNEQYFIHTVIILITDTDSSLNQIDSQNIKESS